jgi:hypothetical protein
MLLPELQKLFPGSKILKCALRARGGHAHRKENDSTLSVQVPLKGRPPAPGTIVVVDEVSEIQLHS